jgi:transcriptional regulator with XRE-family HTH domain
MAGNPLINTIRTKKMGVLMRDARLYSGKSIPECAQALGIDPETYRAYELGETSPSLPEIELLAVFLDVPLDHFWGSLILSKEDHQWKYKPEQLLQLRQKMIGALIRQARMKASLSLDELAGKMDMPSSGLLSYELGETPIPVTVLEMILEALGRPLKEFQDRYGPVGAWSAQQQAVKGFLDLPSDLQAFVSKPINRPYLELAQRLSEMSVEKLRGVAEGLLEITL